MAHKSLRKIKWLKMFKICRLFYTLIIFFLLYSTLLASQSSITESEGYACLSEDRTKRQTEEVGLADAKRKAIEQVSTYIQAETQIKDFEIQKDVINAYANAKVKIISSSGRWDSEPPKIGDCYRVKIKAEVIPDEKVLEKISKAGISDDPSIPLQVQLWTEKKQYRAGEKIKIFLKGNKPFYARVVYKQADGSLVQILPNPYRRDNYFQGGTIYEIPSGPDRFELEVTPPFGEESITVYASTSELGAVEVEPAGGVYLIKTKSEDIADKTRGVKITEKGKSKASEFYETKLTVETR
ncbi:MAG: DUF4384 domain-containing protein [Syntrophorhabdaceae bacterium]|nr:DUF4384 domain-containing protein [Syntrophorhabdaceae bacterium]